MKIENTKMCSLKKLVILLMVIILLFLIVNLTWYTMVAAPFNQYASVVEKCENYFGTSSVVYDKIINDYRYSVVKPEYLNNNGRLVVSNKEFPTVELDPVTMEVIGSSGLYISLYIWRDVWGNFDYGVMFDDEAQGIFEQIMTNDNLDYFKSDQLSEKENKRREQLLRNNYSELREMLDTAKELWSIS